MEIRPQDLPELRSEIVHFHGAHGPAFFDLCIRAGKMPVRPAGSIHESAVLLAKYEAQRVLLAELFWVNPAMTELAKSAAQSLPKFTLMPEDLPAAWGFMVFAEPIYVYPEPGDDRMTHIAAVAWGPWQPRQGWPNGGIWVSWYSNHDLDTDSAAPQQATELQRAQMRAVLPRLRYDLEDQIPFHAEQIPSLDPQTGQQPHAFNEGRPYEKHELLRAVWLLMQQPLAEVADIDLGRAARRRMLRAGQDPRPVRVIELRRPKRPNGEAGEGGREYHHQWIVRGHWRQHWHPKRQVHRPVWIAPHIKGPEGAPLIGGEKVYALKR